MANLTLSRGTKSEINLLPITDGMLSFVTDENKILMDTATERKQYGGDSQEQIGNLQDLDTNDKSNLVGAVNETLDKIPELVDPMQATLPNFAADALKTKEALADKISGYTNPTVIALVSDGSAYTDENGNYILADSQTGESLLVDSATYTTTTLEGNYYRMAGADAVVPFRKEVPAIIKHIGSPITFMPDWNSFKKILIILFERVGGQSHAASIVTKEAGMLKGTISFSNWANNYIGYDSLVENADGSITIDRKTFQSTNIYYIVPYND